MNCNTLLISMNFEIYFMISEHIGCYFISQYFINGILQFLPHSPEGLSGYCFHPWCPDGRAGGGKKVVRAVSQKP